ncbi:hypothetical protein BGX28_000173 [Mortierella sp. GBA30]|nr:hypothetical protein BGX28_000173 [Mortierella sp. GBA30]
MADTSTSTSVTPGAQGLSMSAFTPADSAVPKFKILQHTFMFMNQQPVHIQVTSLDDSAWIWISTGASPLMQQQQQFQGGSSSSSISAVSGSGAGAGASASGSFGDFAMAMPSFRPGQPAVSSTLLGNPIDETAAHMARRLATRFKRQFLVNIDIPATSDNAMLLAFAERKLIETLQVPTSSSGSTTAQRASPSTTPSTALP